MNLGIDPFFFLPFRIAKKMLLAQIKSNYSSGDDSSSDGDGGDNEDKKSKKLKKEKKDEEEEDEDGDGDEDQEGSTRFSNDARPPPVDNGSKRKCLPFWVVSSG